LTSVDALLFHISLTGGYLALIWWSFGNYQWKRLPMNVRTGLFRLYIVVCVPWVAWFGYAALDAALSHSDYPHHVSGVTWKALLIPVGVPLSLLVVFWIMSGFKQSSDGNKKPTVAEARQPKHGQFLLIDFSQKKPPLPKES
jgi:hypothetical protein